MFKRSITAIALLLLYTNQLSAHSGATGIVKERMDNFKQSKASMKSIKNALTVGDFDEIAREASSINTWAKKLVDHFPEGSNAAPSEALSDIWEDFERFQEHSDAQVVASTRLQQAAENSGLDASVEAFHRLAQTCKACHDSYRE